MHKAVYCWEAKSKRSNKKQSINRKEMPNKLITKIDGKINGTLPPQSF